MFPFIKQSYKTITGTCVAAFSVLAAFFGINGVEGIIYEARSSAPATELVFNTTSGRFYSFKQAVTDLRRSLLNKEEAKLTVLKISRAKGIDSEIKISCAKNGFLGIKNTILLASLRPALSSGSQEAARS